MKRVLLWLGILVLVVLGLLIFSNLAGLDDGVLYLRDMVTYSKTPAQPLDANGRFGFCNQFVTLRNAERAQFIENYLTARGMQVERLPIRGNNTAGTEFNNLFVRFGAQGPFTIYSGHYDKVYDDPEYQGASDNSAAVCMLLVAADELHKTSPTKPIGFLFTGQEEVGLVGAKAFYEYATQSNLPVKQVLNFDSMGRAGISARASGERSGFVFNIPFLGEYVYDGRQLAPASLYRQPDAQLLDTLNRIVPITRYDRMVAKSDGTYFQDHGWDAINFSSDNIYYLEETWHTYGDRVELLDEGNFDRAVDLMVGYAQSAE